MHHSDLRDIIQDMSLHEKLSSLISILDQPFDKRSLQDNEFIAITLGIIPFFAEYAQLFKDGIQVLEELSSIINYEYYQPKSVICHQGEPPQKFFLVLEGEVRRYIPRRHEDIGNEMRSKSNVGYTPHLLMKNTQNTVEFNDAKRNSPRHSSLLQPEEFESLHNRRSSLCISKSHLAGPGGLSPTSNNIPLSFRELSGQDQPVQQPEGLKEKQLPPISSEELEFFRTLNQPKKYFLGKMLKYRLEKYYYPGSILNEVALAYNAPYGATLVAWDEVHVASISKLDYERVFAPLIETLKEKIAFIPKILVSESSSKINTYFAYGFEKQIYHKGEKVFNEGTEAQGFWLIAEGEVDLFKTIEAPNDRTNKYEGTMKSGSPQKPKSYKALIVKLSSGQLLGEEGLLELNERSFTAVSKGVKTVVYYLNQRRLELIKRHQREILDFAISKAKISFEGKEQRFRDALKETQVVLNLPKTTRGSSIEDRVKVRKNSDAMEWNVNDKASGSASARASISSMPISAMKLEKHHGNVDELEFLEKLADLKKKIIPADRKMMSPKISMQKVHHAEEASSTPKGIEGKPGDKKFYFPPSFFQHCIENSKDKTIQRRQKFIDNKSPKHQQPVNLQFMPKSTIKPSKFSKNDSEEQKTLQSTEGSPFMLPTRQINRHIPSILTFATGPQIRPIQKSPNESPVEFIRVNTPTGLQAKMSPTQQLSAKNPYKLNLVRVQQSEGSSLPFSHHTPKSQRAHLSPTLNANATPRSVHSESPIGVSIGDPQMEELGGDDVKLDEIHNANIYNFTTSLIGNLKPSKNYLQSPREEVKETKKEDLKGSLRLCLDQALKSERGKGEGKSSMQISRINFGGLEEKRYEDKNGKKSQGGKTMRLLDIKRDNDDAGIILSSGPASYRLIENDEEREKVSKEIKLPKIENMNAVRLDSPQSTTKNEFFKKNLVEQYKQYRKVHKNISSLY